MYTNRIQMVIGILLQNISTSLELFWDDLKKNSEWDLDPPTHFHSKLGFFLILLLFLKPLNYHSEIFFAQV